jgi:hypothetical protein
MLIDITPQEMRAICVAFDLFDDGLVEDIAPDQRGQILQGKRSLCAKLLGIANEGHKMHTAIMDRTEAL